jgi:hypothetical protein
MEKTASEWGGWTFDMWMERESTKSRFPTQTLRNSVRDFEAKHPGSFTEEIMLDEMLLEHG